MTEGIEHLSDALIDKVLLRPGLGGLSTTTQNEIRVRRRGCYGDKLV